MTWQVKLWDTETGQVITSVTTGKIAHCGKIHVHDDKQNIILCGMADKKIVQWDLNTRDIVQEYDQHLSARGVPLLPKPPHERRVKRVDGPRT